MNVGLITAIERRSVIERATPANSPRVASVTRKEGSRSHATSAPLKAPMPSPASMPAQIPAASEWLCKVTAEASAATATIEPNEMSITPADSAKTSPIAITVIGAVCSTMLVRLRALKKPSSYRISAKKAKMTAKPI